LLNPFSDWTTWQQTPLGQQLVHEEQRWLDTTLQDVFGVHAVQIAPPPLDALRRNRMQCRTRVVWPQWSATSTSAAGPQDTADLSCPSEVVSGLQDLPLQTESLDLLVLAHALEVSADPHHLLREAQRVLMPEGRIVIVGFNPWSAWRLRRSSRSVNRFPPSGHQWISLPRVKDWLKLLNFDLGAGGASACGAYFPPVDSERWLRRLAWMDPAGRRWWPMAGGIYFLMAVKRVHHMQLIGPGWRESRAVVRGRAAVTSSSVGVSAPHARAKLSGGKQDV
jgi:SAM-dependent methyltransferase